MGKGHTDVFLDGEIEAGHLGGTAGLQKGSGTGPELNCASDKSFSPRSTRQPELGADISKVPQLLRSTGSAPALPRGSWQEGRPRFPGLLWGDFLMPLAKDCKVFGIGANKQKVFGKAPWHFFF